MLVKSWIAAVALAGLGATAVGAQESPGGLGAMLPGQISASGVGEATITPDRAIIYLGVQSRAATAAAAAADNARRQRAVLDTLRALGLGSDQLMTANYNVMPEMQREPTDREPRVIGYVVSNTVRAEVRKLTDVSRVIDAGLAKGANEISSLQFYASNSDEARRAALSQAVAKAKADADAMAKAAGGSLGALLELSNGDASPRPMFEVGMRATAMSVAPTPIEPGQQTVRATVTGRWLFERGGK